MSSLLALRPEIIKLDLALVRTIDIDPSRHALVKAWWTPVVPSASP
ncbi:EAL domain-containing protein (putative c-di-GMP-specific phosphodiesterase class I) [Rhizobium petrolearium]|nr:hypothetical protein [Neorhizobium petrolearium]MBP1848087.1 EAL domain-containing protein (putative c-di-GMP-specific phosphodiesterase class I) [Neorhizobium petrolearium]